MAQATQLSSTEQDTLVKQIGLALLRSAPRDWQRITAHFRTVGRYHELDGEITLADGTVTEWVATHDIATLFGRLRAGMYREERGTWFNAHYQLEAPASYNLEYDREEPEWNMMPPSQAYADELRMFPRSEENVPDWLMRRLAGLGPERPGPRFRIARVFDGTGQNGRPVINRTELDVEEQDRLLSYLGGAPVVLPGRGYDIDRLAASPEPSVPVAFHSDGTWIWPAAVNYYLQEYGVSPEQDLVEHIRANSYTVPEVTEEQHAAAHDYLTRDAAAPAQQAPPSPQMPRAAHTTASHPVPRPPGKHSAAGQPEVAGLAEPESTQAWQPPADFAASAKPEDAAGKHEADRAAQADVGTQYWSLEDESSSNGSAPSEDEVLERLRAKLNQLDVPPTDYRIGGPTRLGWSLEKVRDGWRVGWYEQSEVSPSNPSLFGDVDDAAAFMLGKLQLEPNGSPRGKRGAAEPAFGRDDFGSTGLDATSYEPPQRDVANALTPEPGPMSSPPAVAPPPAATPPAAQPEPTVYSPPARPTPPPSTTPPSTGAPSAGAPSQPGSWPIQPMPGEPPLTLFRGKKLEDLPAGSELDRFGGPDGNLLYAAGTPFEERSLPPEWVSRPYHVYRVHRPIEVLAGVAIPWFNEPGGGSAYILPASVEELLADRVLIELEPGEPPVD